MSIKGFHDQTMLTTILSLFLFFDWCKLREEEGVILGEAYAYKLECCWLTTDAIVYCAHPCLFMTFSPPNTGASNTAKLSCVFAL